MKTIRERKGWSQPEMGDYLGVHQSTVSRVESGEIGESGPVSKLLDLLEAATEAAATWPASVARPAPSAPAPTAEEREAAA